jgi:hypothetical protein
MFNICWKYLNTEDFDYGNKIVYCDREERSLEGSVERLIEADLHNLSLDYPLLRYASAEWLNHAIAGDPDSSLSLKAIDLAKAPTLRDAWLLRAAKEGNDQTVAQLYKQEANVDITDKRLRSPLSLAAETGHEAKVDAESKDNYGRRCAAPPREGTRPSSSCYSRLKSTSTRRITTSRRRSL